jgi:acylphosphatase
VVAGQVQGVFYRASTQRKAREIGLSGWVRNLPDGRVEVYACGEGTQLDALCAWLEEGPPHAVVTEVQCREIETAVEAGGDFVVR